MLVVAELGCLGGRTEVVEAPLKTNELARRLAPPGRYAARSSWRGTTIPLLHTPTTNCTVAGLEGTTDSPGQSIERLTSTLAEELEWPTNGSPSGSGTLSSLGTPRATARSGN